MTNMIAHVENPSARITIQQVPQASPGHCGICGKGQDPNGFVDPQLDFDYYGSLIFCKDCIAQMAAIFGFISPEDYDELTGELDLTKLDYNEALGKIQELERIVDGFTGYWNNGRVSTIIPSNGPPIPSQVSEVLSNESEPSSESEQSTGSTTSKSGTEITTKQRETSKSSSGKGLLNI